MKNQVFSLAKVEYFFNKVILKNDILIYLNAFTKEISFVIFFFLLDVNKIKVEKYKNNMKKLWKTLLYHWQSSSHVYSSLYLLMNFNYISCLAYSLYLGSFLKTAPMNYLKFLETWQSSGY